MKEEELERRLAHLESQVSIQGEWQAMQIQVNETLLAACEHLNQVTQTLLEETLERVRKAS